MADTNTTTARMGTLPACTCSVQNHGKILHLVAVNLRKAVDMLDGKRYGHRDKLPTFLFIVPHRNLKSNLLQFRRLE